MTQGRQNWLAPLLALFLCLITSHFAAAFEVSDWSKTNPPLNITHIFDGEINRKGKATGFHHLADGENKPTARLKKILSGPNKYGIYTALVEIRETKASSWREKFSSMFPAKLTRPVIVKAILHAFQKNEIQTGRKWRGPSGYGFKIEGYRLQDGRIITAYPLYEEVRE